MVKTPDQPTERPTPEQEAEQFTSEVFHNGHLVKPSKVESASKDDTATDAANEAAVEGESVVEDAATTEVGEDAAVAETDDSAGDEESTTEAEEASDEDEPAAEDEPSAPSVKPKKTAKDRINELVRQKHDLERERELEKAQWEARFAALEAKVAPAAKVEPKPAEPEVKAPEPNNFEYGELDPKYIDAMIEFKATKVADARIAKLEEQHKKEAAAAKIAAEQQALEGTARELRAQGIKKYKDFDEKVSAAVRTWGDVAATTAALALQSSAGSDILYHLATHPTEADEILRKPIVEQARYVGRLEAQFTAKVKPKAPVKVPATPPPVKHTARGVSGNEAAGAATTDFRAFEALAERRR